MLKKGQILLNLRDNGIVVCQLFAVTVERPGYSQPTKSVRIADRPCQY